MGWSLDEVNKLTLWERDNLTTWLNREMRKQNKINKKRKW